MPQVDDTDLLSNVLKQSYHQHQASLCISHGPNFSHTVVCYPKNTSTSCVATIYYVQLATQMYFLPFISHVLFALS